MVINIKQSASGEALLNSLLQRPTPMTGIRLIFFSNGASFNILHWPFVLRGGELYFTYILACGVISIIVLCSHMAHIDRKNCVSKRTS